MAEKVININDTEQMINLFGAYDENINTIQRQYDVVVLSRGSDIKISGNEENVNKAAQAIEALMKISKTGESDGSNDPVCYVYGVRRLGRAA